MFSVNLVNAYKKQKHALLPDMICIAFSTLLYMRLQK